MAENEDSYKFNLDVKDAMKGVASLKEQITSLGEGKNFSGLINGFVELAGPVAALAVGFLAMKTAFDLALDGSQIEMMRKQFDTLADSVGVNSSQMKEDIKNAIGKTVDLDDALKSASKAMVQLGANSKNIPKFMEIAKQAAQAFGGNVTEKFEQISQAVATGNTRILRQAGIIINAQKAMKDYASSIGVTTSALSEQGRQSAIAQAVIAKAAEKFKDIKTDQEGLQTSTKQFGAVWKDLGDTVAVAFNKAFGPSFSKALEYFSNMLDHVSTTLKANFGEGAEAAAARVSDLTDSIATQNRIMEEQQKIFGKDTKTYEYRMAAKQAEIYTKQLENQKNVIAAVAEEERKKAADAHADAIIAGQKTGGGGDVDLQKKKQQETKFNEEMIKLKEKRLQDEMAIETNAEIYHEDQLKQKVMLEQQFEAQIAKIKAEGEIGDQITRAQAAQMIIQVEADKNAQLSAMDLDMEKNSLRVYDNQLKAAKTYSAGMKAAMSQMYMSAKHDSKDFGTQAVKDIGSVKTHAVAGFKAIGDGSKSAGDAMKDFMFSSLADIAQAHGEILLAEGIGSYNPVQIAEGGALIAIAGALGSQGGGSSSGGSSGGGSSGGGSSGGPPSQSLGSPTLQSQQQKTVTLQVQGNIYETDQTKQRLMDLIRQETDATDFKYQQIGVG